MDELKRVEAELSHLCADAVRLFKPGAKVALIIHNPKIKNADILVGDATRDEIESVLDSLKVK